MNKNYQLSQMVRGAGISLFFGIFGYIFVFLFKLVVARNFGPTTFGTYSLAETIFKILLTISLLGIPEGIVRFIPLYKKDFGLLKGYLLFSFLTPLFFSFIVASLLFMFSGSIVTFFNFPSSLGVFLKFIAFLLPLQSMLVFFKKILLSQKKIFSTQLSINILEKGLPFLFVLLFIVFDVSSLFIFIAYGLGLTIGLIYCVKSINHRVFLLPQKKKLNISSWFLFSTPLLFSGVFAFLISWSDNLVIGKFLSPQDLGIYSIVYSFAAFLSFFSASFIPLFIPILSDLKSNSLEYKFFLRKISSWIFAATLPFCLLFIVFARPLLSFIYGPIYATGYFSLIILAIAFLLNSTLGLSRELLIFKGKTFRLFGVNIIIACLNIFLNIILVPHWGLIGAAISSAFSLVLISIIVYFSVPKKLLYIDIFTVGKYFLSGLVALVPVYFIYLIPMVILIKLIIATLVYFSSYIFCFVLFKAIDKKDKELVSLVRKKIKI